MGFRRSVVVALGLFFVASGIPKVVPVQPLHGQMVSEFKSYNRVFPLKHFGITVEADIYRTLVGVAEIAMGVLLAFGCSDAARMSALGLLTIMVGAVYTCISLEMEPVRIAIPGGLCCLLFWVLFGDRY